MKTILFTIGWIFTFVVISKHTNTDCIQSNTFLGTMNMDWDNAANWSANCIPSGNITGIITITSDCIISGTNTDNNTLFSLVIEKDIILSNNTTGQWTIVDLSGEGVYDANLSITGVLRPGILQCVEGLHPAFSDFNSENMTIYIDGDEVVIETNGLPNHTSPYWSNTNERCLQGPGGGNQTICTNSNTTVDHPLYVEPTVTSFDMMAPGNIDDFNGMYTLRVPVVPQLANSSSSTGLGAIGMAVSGSVIYNDEEGPNVPLDNAVSSLDYSAAHTGPQSYHYHLEPKAWSEDDDKLIGIISDGFFIYGRKCASTGTYPTDLDDSGGHISTTQHCGTPYYHYHIQNELYLNEYYILFPGDYQGTPNTIN